MNKTRLKEIAAIVAAVTELQQHSTALGDIDTLRGKLEDLQSEEESAYDNLSENLQAGTQGQRSEAAKDALQEAAEKAQELVDGFGELLDKLNEIE